MSTTNKRIERGPLRYRVLIGFFSVILFFLALWLLGFILGDIGDIQGPSFSAIEQRHLDAALEENKADLEKEQEDLAKQIADRQKVQEVLETSTDNSQQTMRQLMEMYESNLKRDLTPSEAERTALADSEKRFLQNQEKFQEANEAIARLSERQRAVEREIAAIEEKLEEQRAPARAEFNRLNRRHQLKVASLKLVFLVPFLFGSAWLMMRWRNTRYLPIFRAVFAAAFLQTGLVMHQHFPGALFKYIALAAGIVVVLAALVHLIRTLAAPKPDWLIKQYREAYNNRLCPICAFPIQRSPLRFARWTRRTAALPAPLPETTEESPYTCPSCGQALYEPCAHCSKIRHTLLPHCEHCGAGPEQTETLTP